MPRLSFQPYLPPSYPSLRPQSASGERQYCARYGGKWSNGSCQILCTTYLPLKKSVKPYQGIVLGVMQPGGGEKERSNRPVLSYSPRLLRASRVRPSVRQSRRWNIAPTGTLEPLPPSLPPSKQPLLKGQLNSPRRLLRLSARSRAPEMSASPTIESGNGGSFSRHAQSDSLSRATEGKVTL